MMVRVLLFARARDLVGTDRLELDLPAGATVQMFRETLATQQPSLAALMDRCAVALEHDYLANDEILPDGVTVALIPPVSGGSGLLPPLVMSSTNHSPQPARKIRRKIRVKRRQRRPDPDQSILRRIDWVRVVTMIVGTALLAAVALLFILAVLPRLEGRLH